MNVMVVRCFLLISDTKRQHTVRVWVHCFMSMSFRGKNECKDIHNILFALFSG